MGCDSTLSRFAVEILECIRYLAPRSRKEIEADLEGSESSFAALKELKEATPERILMLLRNSTGRQRDFALAEIARRRIVDAAAAVKDLLRKSIEQGSPSQGAIIALHYLAEKSAVSDLERCLACEDLATVTCALKALNALGLELVQDRKALSAALACVRTEAIRYEIFWKFSLSAPEDAATYWATLDPSSRRVFFRNQPRELRGQIAYAKLYRHLYVGTADGLFPPLPSDVRLFVESKQAPLRKKAFDSRDLLSSRFKDGVPTKASHDPWSGIGARFLVGSRNESATDEDEYDEYLPLEDLRIDDELAPEFLRLCQEEPHRAQGFYRDNELKSKGISCRVWNRLIRIASSSGNLQLAELILTVIEDSAELRSPEDFGILFQQLPSLDARRVARAFDTKTSWCSAQTQFFSLKALFLLYEYAPVLSREILDTLLVSKIDYLTHPAFLARTLWLTQGWKFEEAWLEWSKACVALASGNVFQKRAMPSPAEIAALPPELRVIKTLVSCGVAVRPRPIRRGPAPNHKFIQQLCHIFSPPLTVDLIRQYEVYTHFPTKRQPLTTVCSVEVVAGDHLFGFEFYHHWKFYSVRAVELVNALAEAQGYVERIIPLYYFGRAIYVCGNAEQLTALAQKYAFLPERELIARSAEYAKIMKSAISARVAIPEP